MTPPPDFSETLGKNLADARQFEDLIRFRHEAISVGFPEYIYHSESEEDF